MSFYLNFRYKTSLQDHIQVAEIALNNFENELEIIKHENKNI